MSSADTALVAFDQLDWQDQAQQVWSKALEDLKEILPHSFFDDEGNLLWNPIYRPSAAEFHYHILNIDFRSMT